MKHASWLKRILGVSLWIFPLLLIGYFLSLPTKSALSKRELPEPTGTLPSTPTTPVPSETLTATATITPRPSNTPSGTATLPWLGTPGAEVEVEIDCPILLYHHVTGADKNDRYAVSKAVFKKQMTALKNAGYNAVPMSDFVSALRDGVQLPEKSFVITFDDGYLDVYNNAFPVLKELGWTATVYLIVDMMDEPNQLSYAQAQELARAGWEFGSHTMSHANLAQDNALLIYEIDNSKFILENRLGVPVDTFAYPYGEHNAETENIVNETGYLAGMGIGLPTHHKKSSQFFLSRIEVTHDITIETLLGMLPWQ